MKARLFLLVILACLVIGMLSGCTTLKSTGVPEIDFINKMINNSMEPPVYYDMNNGHLIELRFYYIYYMYISEKSVIVIVQNRFTNQFYFDESSLKDYRVILDELGPEVYTSKLHNSLKEKGLEEIFKMYPFHEPKSIFDLYDTRT